MKCEMAHIDFHLGCDGSRSSHVLQTTVQYSRPLAYHNEIAHPLNHALTADS